MKTRSIFLILFLACQALYAQTSTGISVQGIARNANKAAIVAQTLTFTFTVSGTPSGGSPTEYYKETQAITTDAFGVFSHILGSGNPSAFANVPFGKAHMSLKVEAGNVVLLDGPLQYAPYAKSADNANNANNGVPVGGVIMWRGDVTKIPEGWALCDGTNNTPDLRGRFIAGYSNDSNDPNPDYKTIGNTGGEKKHALTVSEMPSHNHNGNTVDAGDHSHGISAHYYFPSGSTDTATGLITKATWDSSSDIRAINGISIQTAGNHTHQIPSNGGGEAHENRPPYYVLAYIIRLQ
jgi:microcystin-dependent protein